ncbi:MAG: hypothetical protein QF921_17865 [Pseudomonadales bacterium]|nr:hypothetical protein [Pseudomonadales bacterium]MDP6470408.1 hypothetical protein [Pseudomonadales bacterium]MDP6827708.1 hypothetical protein [Pseudomonadales bacterium]MDP6973353.1 hypothetical protein [Pseudomonadales bacterium]
MRLEGKQYLCEHDNGLVVHGEGAVVRDDQRARFEVREVDRESGRIQRDQDVRFVPGSGDAFTAELDLKGTNPEAGACRGADFYWKVRECGQLVAGEGGSDRELLSLQLDTVTGISGKGHDMVEFVG